MDDFHAKMSQANVLALWEQDQRHNLPAEPTHLWRWGAVSPLLDEAVAATDMNNAERRVLILRNPSFEAGRDGAAANLSVNLQILMPGERARPHRHTMHALRFALEGSGATTVVEGKECPMHPGDLILTPGLTWHEHYNDGKERSVWVDALDVPLHRYLENSVFEPGPSRNVTALPPDSAFVAGFSPATPAIATNYSPMFRYPWQMAVKALDALPAESDGSRVLRYTNPVTGGAVLSTIDCYLLGLAKGMETVAYRTNTSAVCVVAEGEGQSRIGDELVKWGPKDIFVLPHGQWISHKASSASARLFQITDRELYRRLDFLRDETRH